MIEAKANFKGQHINDLKCVICQSNEETTQHLLECEGYKELRKNIRVEDTPMKTLRKNNLKVMAEVLNKITEKRKRVMEENKTLTEKKKTEKKEKDGEKKHTLNQPQLLSAQSVSLLIEGGVND